MRILVYGAPAETAMGRMCARGLESIGHEVVYFERDVPSVPLLGEFGTATLHEDFTRSVRSHEPDAVLVMKGYDLSRKRLERLGDETGVVLVNWNPDNPYQVRSERRVTIDYLDTLPVYDVVFTWGEFLIDKLADVGGSDVRHLPFAHDPEFHFPASPQPEYECDVGFLGHYSSKRERHLGVLTDLDFQLRGNMWRWKCFDWSLRRAYQGPALGHPKYTQAMSSATIVVNVVADHNLPAHNMRTFEAPASGSLMVTTRSDGQQTFFPDEYACVMYDDPGELREVVEYYLDDEESREAIAARGRELVQEHTYVERMRRVTEAVEEYL